MSRVHVLVEGQTEETFVRDILQPHFEPLGAFLTPILAATKRIKSGLKFKGGINSYPPVRNDLRRLLGDRSAVVVTTMIDYYGLPEDFPGVPSLRSGTCYQRAEHLERSLAQDLGTDRFLPYLSLHEFEALLFVDHEAVHQAFAGSPATRDLAETLPPVGSPEEINDGPDTHPSARLEQAYPTYRKTVHGPIVTARIGLPRLRQRCPHFNAWLCRLEELCRQTG